MRALVDPSPPAQKSRLLKEQEHFDRLAEETGEIWWGSKTPAGMTRLKRRTSLVTQVLGHLHDPAVLELGCGTGAFSEVVLEAFPWLRLTACDISPRSIEMAQRRCADYPHASFDIADVNALPYPSEAFEMVIGNSVLHHLPLDTALPECFRVLKPGGVFWFAEPNMLNPQVALERNVRFIGKWLQNSEDETAFIRWSLAVLLRTEGYDQVSVVPFDFMHPLIPSQCLGLARLLEWMCERTPLVREIAGSLVVYAHKPNQPHG